MGTYSYSGNPQFITVGATGTYHIIAYGAQGGPGFHGTGGLGAEYGAYFSLTKGETLEIIVGGAGAFGAIGGGGGGGTFVFEVNGNGSYTPLIAAGGGGGGSTTAYQDGGSGQATTSGTNTGGSAQSGGGGGGAGVAGNGGYNSYRGGAGGTDRSGNFAGGPGRYVGNGGFGGGGGGAGLQGAGGGGGYSGGNGGFFNGATGATNAEGGSSFSSTPSVPSEDQSGVRAGDGLLTITPNANVGTYGFTGSAHFVTVSATGIYDITAYGGQGGGATGAQGGSPGLGAERGGDFSLTAGERLEIVVGGAGVSGINGGGGGGGGGSFVLEVNGNGTYTPLLVAGGGGGGYANSGGNAQLSAGTGAGGSAQGVYGGGGGSGVKGDGAGTPKGGVGGSNDSGSYAGGHGGYGGGTGGFGGGGGGGFASGGGGGGYSGGGYAVGGGATGGSSYISSAATRTVAQSNHAGDGLIKIAPSFDTTNTSIYDTSAGTNAQTLADSSGNTFGFSFTTTSASTFASYKVEVDNPGGGTGSISLYLESNGANNTPGTQLLSLGTTADSALSTGGFTFAGTGSGYSFAADTRYWLVGANSAGSNLKLVVDDGSPNIGNANEFLYDSSFGTQSVSNASEGSSADGQIVVTVPDAVCFAAGTRIRIARGGTIADVAVEALQVGDLAVTASGAHRPIRWLGSRTIDCRADPRPHATRPVRIAAHAFGPNRPDRDLFVSPGHSICVDVCGEVLIPAASLVNGSTIAQVEVDKVTYWHVELDGGHNILLAENLPAESYLEMDNRGFFAETDVVDLAAGPDAAPRTHADFCRPFHDGGALVEVVRAQSSARAERLGWRLDRSSAFAGLHLVVDGNRIEPTTRGLSARFIVPADASDVWLASTSARPSDVGVNEDGRVLGVWLAGLTIEDGFAARSIPLDDPLLGCGLHALEADGCRWTAGRARLPAALWDGCEHDFYLRVDLAGPASPRWVAPGEIEDLQLRATA